MSKIRIGIIGTGGVSYDHGRQLSELEEAAIVAITEPNEANGKRFSDIFGLTDVRRFDDYRDMLEQQDLDAVVICSPHTLHFAHAMDALASGRHVLVQKPMTCSSEESEQLVAAANEAGKVLQVNFQRHFQPEFMYIRSVIADGTIGRLTSVNATLYQDWKSRTINTWRQIPSLSGGGMLMDSGAHIIDMLLWTTGLTPQEVFPQLHMQGASVEIDTFTSIRFKEGPIGTLNIVGLAPCYREMYAFVGEEGGIFYDDGKITLYNNKESRIITELPVQETNADKSFIDAILGRSEVQVSGEFALKVVRMTEMIYENAAYSPLGNNG